MKGSCFVGSRCIVFAVFLFVATVLTACSGGGGGSTSTPPAPPSLKAINVVPGTSLVAAGLTQQFKATGSWSDGSTSDLTSSVAWTSATTGVATINTAGLATSRTQGTSVITATSGSMSGSATLTVSPAVLVSLGVTPGTSTVAAGLTQQFKATGSWSDSSTSDLTSSVAWTSVTTGVATINTAGLATSRTQGTSVITATSGSVSGSATLTVNPPVLVSIAVTAATLQLGTVARIMATGTYTDQSTQDLTDTAAWSATNGYVANVSPSGVVTTVGAGETTVTAVQQGLQASAPVTVLASPRYLYVSADASRTLTRMVVDGSTGQPRFAGYTQSLLTGNIGFPCLTVDPSGTHAYLATQILNGSGSGYSGTVGIYSIDPSTGTLNAILGGPFAVSFPLGCVKFDPSGKFAYATSGIENAGDQLGVFSVNPDATLTLNNTLSFPYYPTGVAVDPAGQFVYVDVVDVLGGTSGSSQLYGYSIDATTGALAALTGSPWSLPAGTYGQLAFHPSGAFLYASDLNAINILEYSLNRSSGAPTLAETVDSTCINPSALQFLPNGNNAYALCGESASGSVTNAPVVQFSVGTNGQLNPRSTAFAGAIATQMQVDEAGQFLYVLGSGSDFCAAGNNSTTIAANVVLAFQVQPDGSLKLVKQIAGHVLENSMALLSGPAPVQWKTTSAYITTSGDNRVTPYTVGTDGTLVAGTGLSTDSGPFSATMLPWGSDLLFATQTAAPNLYGYATFGAATSSGSSFGLASAPGGSVIGPSGDWAFATDPASGLVDQFSRISAGNWTTTFASPGVPSTFSAGAGVGPITMDPSGRYIVVANQTARSISLIEPLGAALTPATSLSFTPLTITADGTGNLIFAAGDDGNLHMFSSNGLGALTEVAEGTLASVATASIAVDPLSRFVYAAGPAGLTAFAIDITAARLTPIALNPGVSLQNATGVYADPSGQYLYIAVSNGSANALYLFTINADGTLTAAATNPVAAPKNVTSMTFQATIQ